LLIVAPLHWAYQNHCHKIADCCVLALGLPKPLPENCRELRPCTGLTKTNARKLPRVASLYWAYQNYCRKIRLEVKKVDLKVEVEVEAEAEAEVKAE
jgi:hypothetical protein